VKKTAEQLEEEEKKRKEAEEEERKREEERLERIRKAEEAERASQAAQEKPAVALCKTKRQLTPRDEAGSCEGRCAENIGFRCCPESNRCVKKDSPCEKPPANCIGTCGKGWSCCIAQGNQCLKHPIPAKAALCKCLPRQWHLHQAKAS